MISDERVTLVILLGKLLQQRKGYQHHLPRYDV